MIHPRALFLLALLALVCPLGFAQSSPEPDTRATPHPPSTFSRIRGLFDIDLPELDPPGTVKLIFRPHVSDFVRRDYLRTDAGFRWALNDDFEFSSEAATFVTHGFGDSSPGYGIGEIHVGTKYIFPRWLRPDYEASVSLNLDRPVGHPPFEMTDGHNHYSPGVVVQHHSGKYPRLTTFVGTSVDFITPSSVPGAFQPNQPRNDAVSFTAGGVYEAGQLKWTLTGTYATTAWIGGIDEHFFYLQPGLQWYVPKKLTFHSKTQWIVGFGTPMTWGPAGFEFKANTRLRAEITFRQVIDNIRVRITH